MNANIPFWQEIRSSVMPRGTGWREVIESLPRRLDAAEVKSMLQSASQLTSANMQGVAYLAGVPERTTLNPDILFQYLAPTLLTPENIVLQWLYQFFIIEGLDRAMADLNSKASIADWPPMILDMYVRGLQFMVYMAALLVLFEETKIDICFLDGSLHEELVKARVMQTTKNLYAKAQDYGESFRRHGIQGVIPRLWDKIARYTQLRSEDRVPNFESQQDSARDLLGYSAIAWSLVLEVPAAHDIQKTVIER